MTKPQGLAETINFLRAQGYTEDYNLPTSPLHPSRDGSGDDEEFAVDKVYRFDVDTDPEDQSVLYAIHSKKTGKKGVLVNGFGLYTEPITNAKLVELLRWEGRV